MIFILFVSLKKNMNTEFQREVLKMIVEKSETWLKTLSAKLKYFDYLKHFSKVSHFHLAGCVKRYGMLWQGQEMDQELTRKWTRP